MRHAVYASCCLCVMLSMRHAVYASCCGKSSKSLTQSDFDLTKREFDDQSLAVIDAHRLLFE